MRLFKKFSFKFFYLFRFPFYKIFADNKDLIDIPESMLESIDSICFLISKSRNIKCIQFLKVLLAAKLRYDISSYDFKNKALNKNYLSKKYKKELYCSNIEPVIHLKSDPLEKKEISPYGNIHNDYDERGGIMGTEVLWIPATDYLYPGIVMMPKIIQLIAHIFSTFPNIFKFIIISQKNKTLPIRQNHKKGSLIKWNDSFLHGGIPNFTPNSAVALVLRVANKKSVLTPYKIYKDSYTKKARKSPFLDKKELEKVSINIDKIINKLTSNQSNIDEKFVEEWIIYSKKKLNDYNLENNSEAYKYILNFWETREKLICKYGF